MSDSIPDIDSLEPVDARTVRSTVRSDTILSDNELLACDFNPDEMGVFMKSILLQGDEPDDQISAVFMYGRTKLKEVRDNADELGLDFEDYMDEHTENYYKELMNEDPDSLRLIDVEDIIVREPVMGDSVTVICENCMQAYDNPQIETCPDCGSEVVEHETIEIETSDHSDSDSDNSENSDNSNGGDDARDAE